MRSEVHLEGHEPGPSHPPGGQWCLARLLRFCAPACASCAPLSLAIGFRLGVPRRWVFESLA